MSQQHEATVDKGLKMKIKRKNMPHSTSPGDSMVQNSSPTSANTAGTGVIPSPFEKLKQAILEREKNTKGPKNMHQKKEHHVKNKGGSPLSSTTAGASPVAMGSPSGNPSGIPINGVAESERNKSDMSADPYEFNAKVEDSPSVEFPVSKKLKVEKHDADMLRDVATDTCDMSVITEPDLMGPCDPGTSVVLEGIVWQETENGLLVVNITWRGKTYVGALLDATKHEWAPPSFRSDSPSEVDNRTPGRASRGKRGRQTMNSTGGRGRSTRSTPHLSAPVFAVPASPIKRRAPAPSPGDVAEVPPAKRTRGASTPGAEIIGEDGLIECPEPNCGKKYRHMNGLKYHQSHAHKEVMLRIQNDPDSINEQSDNATKKEKKKKNKDGKKKKGKKTSDSNHVSAHITDDDTSNCTIKCEETGKNVSFKQPTVQLTPVTVANKTVTAPIASVPMASNVNMLSNEMKSKKSKDKKLGIKTESGSQDESVKEIKQEKKAKKKKKDKNRDKTHKQSLDIKTENKVSECDVTPSSVSARNDSTDSQQPINLSNKTECTPDKTVPTESVQSPAYSDISDDGNDNTIVESESIVNKEDHTAKVSPASYGQPPSLTPVFSADPRQGIINLTTKDNPSSSQSAPDAQDAQPKEGAPAEASKDKSAPYGVPQFPYPGYQYSVDYSLPYAVHERNKEIDAKKGEMKVDQRAQQQQQHSPANRAQKPRPEGQPQRIADSPASESRLMASYMARDDLHRRLEQLPPEKRLQYEHERRQRMYYDMMEYQRQQERKNEMKAADHSPKPRPEASASSAPKMDTAPPSPRRTPTPSNKDPSRTTPTSSPYPPYYYPATMYAPPHSFMSYPPGYHPPKHEGKALELLQQHASQIHGSSPSSSSSAAVDPESRHNERARDERAREQNSPRHLLPPMSPYSHHMYPHFQGSLSSPQTAARMGPPK